MHTTVIFFWLLVYTLHTNTIFVTNYNMGEKWRISKWQVKLLQKVINNNISTLESVQVKGNAAVVVVWNNIEEEVLV